MVANQHRDIVCGVKVRMGATTVGYQRHRAGAARSVQAAERCDLPIMVHIAVPPPGIEEFLPLLRAGDIITHCFTGLPMKLFDDDGRLFDVARRAIDKGVILDIGHGAGSFAFRTAEAALAAGIKPHAISTDIHQISIAGPMFDLPTCLSKFLALGLDLREVIAMATEAPARILRYEDRGSLRVRRAGRHRAVPSASGQLPALRQHRRDTHRAAVAAERRNHRRRPRAGTSPTVTARHLGGTLGPRWHQRAHPQVPVRPDRKGPHAGADVLVWMTAAPLVV